MTNPLRNIIKKFYQSTIGKSIDRRIVDHLLFKKIIYGESKRLKIAETAVINNALFNTVSGDILVEDYVFFGHNVCILTGTHDVNQFFRARQLATPVSGRDVTIKMGAWIASNATILGPCCIGEHSVVAAGAVVTSDVEPYTIVGGCPAKPIGSIKHRPTDSAN